MLRISSVHQKHRGKVEKYQNKYRIASARWQTWDYSSNGSYFLTICSKKREHYFGRIVNGEMCLNEIGMIAAKCWAEIPNHFQNVRLDEFVIMPNHVHGIIVIERAVETGHALSLQKNAPSIPNVHPRFRNQGKNTISAMAGSFKSAVTRLAKTINPGFGWQARFHDHVIRDEFEFNRISNYIKNNPAKWQNDKFNK